MNRLNEGGAPADEKTPALVDRRQSLLLLGKLVGAAALAVLGCKTTGGGTRAATATTPDDLGRGYTYHRETAEEIEDDALANEDLLAVKQDGCSNYPYAELLLKFGVDGFDRMYLSRWQRQTVPPYERRWRTVSSMDDELKDIAVRQAKANADHQAVESQQGDR